jgi:hypothetical protein
MDGTKKVMVGGKLAILYILIIVTLLCGDYFDVSYTSNDDAPHINHKARDLCLVIAPSFVTFEQHARHKLCSVASWLFC